MSSWSISRRIYVGFGVILVALITLSGVTIFANSQVAGVFGAYQSSAKSSLLVGELMEDLLEARMAALKYRISPNSSTAGEVTENIKEISSQDDAARQMFSGDRETLAVLNKLSGDSQEYKNKFNEMRALQADREQLVSDLVEIGPQARKNLSDVMTSAYRDGDVTAAFYAGVVQENLLLGRFYTERFLLTNTEDSYKTAAKHLANARADVDRLLSELSDPTRRRLTIASGELIDRYRDVSIQVFNVIQNRNEFRAAMDRLGPEMADGYDSILERIVDKQVELGAEGSATTNIATWTGLAIAIVALLVGCAIAFWIGRAAHRMSRGVSALAEGDLDLDIAGDQSSYELGLMAKALTMFKDNAKRMETLAAEREEADRVAAEEKRQMMAELSDAFGRVVDAAVAGDFSQRVPARFDDPALSQLADGLNRLAETVEIGLSETGRVLNSVADGQLDVRMRGDFHGAFADLQTGVNQVVEKLSSLVGEIRNTSSTIRGEVDSIASDAEALSGRAEQQASALEETAATMEEMSASVKSNAENAAQANRLATDASSRAEAGGAIVQQAVDAMGEIETGAQKIADIISVIDGIAFQTNLLALNAAVEAARAGEAGKGFAVVAAEVRSLAQRASEAARDIRELISTSTAQVGDGAQLVASAGDALQEIVAAIKDVEASVQSIADASGEQSSGVQEISAAISHMDGMTQQNASMAEQSAANARRLAGNAVELDQQIGFFKNPGETTTTTNEQPVFAAA